MTQIDPFAAIIGESPRMKELVELARRVAQTEAVVLITGESGTGKEMFAKAIHAASLRAGNTFVAVNCAAVPESLLETELFGHERGAFTGAVASRKGKFELANGGTLFLDEIGDMSLPAQAAILRAIEERQIQRIGGQHNVDIDIRIITSTNRPLPDLVRQNRFRTDLYYRLNEIHLHLPPLREHKEDIPALVKHFISYYARTYSKRLRGISDAASQFLLRHDWPGNIRELNHVIKCATLMADGDTIWLEHIPLEFHGEGAEANHAATRADEVLELLSLDEVERRHILRIMEFTGWNKSQTAKILGVSRPTLDRKIERYGLEELRSQVLK